MAVELGNRRIEQQQIKEAVEGIEEDYGQDIPKDVTRDVSQGVTHSPMSRMSQGNSMQLYPSQSDYSPGTMEVGDYGGMQPSMLGSPQNSEPQAAEGEYYDQQGYGGYNGPYAQTQYQPYQEAMSSDVISEVAEQIVTEKLSAMHDKLEQAIDFRNIADARISSLNERLIRIEKIIDRLQLSLLQKVGEYVNDVSELKGELSETQKSFKTLLSKKKSKSKP